MPGELVPMTPMRKKIAERMVESKHTSAHVHSVFKVDMTRIAKFREKNRKAWEARNGVKLTFLPFIAKALLHGIRVKPIINASVVGDSIQYHKNVNIGIAVALDWGLIVPVVKGAENLSFVGLQRAIVDLGERARTKKLVPDDVQGGTITITNPGIYGPQFGLPIILQPQVAILGMGGIFKEPVVVTDEDGNDSIAVRHIIRLSVGYDHRIIDGADADQFMVAVREYLEGFNEDIGYRDPSLRAQDFACRLPLRSRPQIGSSSWWPCASIWRISTRILDSQTSVVLQRKSAAGCKQACRLFFLPRFYKCRPALRVLLRYVEITPEFKCLQALHHPAETLHPTLRTCRYSG